MTIASMGLEAASAPKHRSNSATSPGCSTACRGAAPRSSGGNDDDDDDDDDDDGDDGEKWWLSMSA